MNNCVFCKIVEDEIPCYKVYEDEDFVSFLDLEPSTKGHCLVIPKDHVRWTIEVPSFGSYFEVAKKVGLATQKSLSADWIHFATYGIHVPHAHIHIIPRYKDDKHDVYIDPNKGEKYNKKEMNSIADKISRGI